MMLPKEPSRKAGSVSPHAPATATRGSGGRTWLGWLAACLIASALVRPSLGSDARSSPPPWRPPVSPFGNVENFQAIEARFVRFIILETNGGSPCLDELEVFTAEADPRNVASRDAGAHPAASLSEVIPTIHQLRNLNDGRFGNNFSWLGGGSHVANGSVQQMVDIQHMAEAVDRGLLAATLSAWLGGWGPQNDWMVIRAVFLDKDNEPLGEPLTGAGIEPVSTSTAHPHAIALKWRRPPAIGPSSHRPMTANPIPIFLNFRIQSPDPLRRSSTSKHGIKPWGYPPMPSMTSH